jgi:outer membrane lipoprotein carrier protein
MNLKRTLTAVVLFLSSFPLHAAASLDQIMRSTAGQQAEFVHRFTPKGFKKAQVERGKVAFGTAPQMRWTYTAPEAKVFVFDGRTSWMYAAAERQVTVTRLTDAQRKSIPLAFLWDPAAKRSYSSSERRTAKGTEITLAPTAADAPLKQIRVELGGDGRIRLVDYLDRQGNRTQFELSKYTPLPSGDAVFTFTPPAGVQVIEN